MNKRTFVNLNAARFFAYRLELQGERARMRMLNDGTFLVRW